MVQEVADLVARFLDERFSVDGVHEISQVLRRHGGQAIARAIDIAIADRRYPEAGRGLRSFLSDVLSEAKSAKDWGNVIAAMRKLTRSFPDHVTGYLEAAAAATALREFDEAETWLEQAHNRISAMSGDKKERLTNAHELIRQKMAFLKENDLEKTRKFCSQLTGKHGILLSPSQMEGEIMSALRERRPYHLVRLGDGEGVILGAINKKSYPLARRETARGNTNIWFGKDAVIVDEFIQEIRDPILAAINDADVVGAPSFSPLGYSWEKDHRGYFGYFGVIEHLNQINCKKKLTNSHVNVAMQQIGSWKRILSSVKECIIISCHPQMENLIKERFDMDRVKIYLVPARAASSELFSSAVSKPHFPDMYRDVLGSLEVWKQGTLCLNAAGFLGKIYGARLKALGGVVADVGSVADFWLGHRSRVFTGSVSEDEWRQVYML